MSKTQELANKVTASAVRKEVNKDKYGRTVTQYSISQYDEAAKSESNRTGFVASFQAVVVNLPKVWVERHGTKFLVNDWSIRGNEGVSYHTDRLDAHLSAVNAVIAAATK